MFKSQQKLILYQLNVYNILYIFFLKIFFSEIFYIKISGCLKNLKIIKILKKIKINWLNFQDYDIGESYYRALKKNIYYSDYISKILVNKIWDEDIRTIYLKKNYLEACLSFKIQKESQKIFQIFEISKILSINNTKISILLHKSFFTKNIKKKYYSNYLFKILPIINFSYLIYSFDLLFLIARALYDKYFYLISFNKNFSSFRKKLRKNKKNKIIYFPHKGIFYLDRLKDQFYSLNKNSPLNKENITHIEWQSNDIDKKSSIFYDKNKISLEIWESLKYSKFHLISNAKLILKKISILFKLYNYNILYLFLRSVFQILKAQEKLLHFKDARLALVGYDFLFPLELSLALKKAGIKTVCIQERILQSAFSHKMIFDHYFVIGPKSYKILSKRMSKTILNFHKYYLWHTNKFNLKKHKLKKNKNLNCLIIDTHSENDWYSNGNVLNNWRHNKNFYEIIIELAKKNTNINFLIKSKNYSWTKNSFFLEIVQKIENMPNINILKDSKKWSPENCLVYVDFAIARHSSLSDQMLYINKPILIYDSYGFPSIFFSFGRNIICKNKKDLEKKFTLLINNILGYNQKLNKTRKLLFYYNSIVNLKVFLEKKLKQ